MPILAWQIFGIFACQIDIERIFFSAKILTTFCQFGQGNFCEQELVILSSCWLSKTIRLYVKQIQFDGGVGCQIYGWSGMNFFLKWRILAFYHMTIIHVSFLIHKWGIGKFENDETIFMLRFLHRKFFYVFGLVFIVFQFEEWCTCCYHGEKHWHLCLF